MRTIYSLNALNWRFARLESPDAPLPAPKSKSWQDVTLPHVWNKDAPAQAGCCIYQASFGMDKHQLQKRHFIEFEAVAGVCRAELNGQSLGEHWGGYAAFRFALDGALQAGANTLTVYADNTRYSYVTPLTGDFDNYGGIYRDVKMIEVEDTHFDLLYHGTQGVEIDAAADGTVKISPHIVGGTGAVARYTVLDGEAEVAVLEAPAANEPVELRVNVPHLWNGKADPHCYTLRAQLIHDGAACDQVELAFGFRGITIDADKGFSLNGRHLRLNGVAKHQDREGMGCAPTRAQLDEDMVILKELGANAVRLSHYQHPQYFYDLCDKEGLVVWAEIPMLAMPDGNDGVFENAKSQLTELILQNKHHPSICFWGIQNEIAMMGESLEMYDKVAKLNSLAKQLDPSRLTTAANLYCVKNNSQLNFIPDCIGYNLYYGWYYGEMGDYTGFIRKFRNDNPGVPLGFSEYGVDCNLAYHSETPRRKDYSEEYQALYHETVYPQLTTEPAVWGSFVWNLFDFSSSIRDEGGVKGRNSKGLVTWDRQTKKDAFYYYKAQWSEELFVHIAGRRFVKRSGESTTVKVYSNCSEVTLTTNGREIPGRQTAAGVFSFTVPLDAGALELRAEGTGCADSITLEHVAQPEQSYIYVDPNPEIDVKNWFTMQDSGEDLFPEDRFSIMDPIGEILDNAEALALLETELPAIAHDERSRKYRSMGLIRIINRMPHKPDEDFLKDLNRKLNTIPKKTEGRK